MLQKHFMPPHLAALRKQYCEIQKIPGTPIQLMAARHDSAVSAQDRRWIMGQESLSGPHEANTAMWSVPFSGGICLAQYIHAHPEEFRGKRLLDVGSGSGVVAIAAALAGAEVTAIDSSSYACASIGANAQLNGVKIEVVEGDATMLNYDANAFGAFDIVTAADVFYVHKARNDLIAVLPKLAAAGRTVYATSQDEKLAEHVPTNMSAKNLATEGYGPSFIRISAVKPASAATRPGRAIGNARRRVHRL